VSGTDALLSVAAYGMFAFVAPLRLQPHSVLPNKAGKIRFQNFLNIAPRCPLMREILLRKQLIIIGLSRAHVHVQTLIGNEALCSK
jgi:hypothetical protein